MATKNGKVALITGGNKGLGKEIARQLGGLGYTVVITARDEQAGRGAPSSWRGGDAHAVRLEVTSAEHIAALALSRQDLREARRAREQRRDRP